MADLNHPDARTTFEYHGFIATSDPTSKHVEEPARADFKLIKAGRGVCVEVKDGKDDNGHAFFDLTEWRDNQREWSYQWCESLGTAYWIYLRMGISPKNKEYPYITWLLPRKVMGLVCGKVQVIQNRLPYRVRPGISVEMQKYGFDALTLFAGYELQCYDKQTLPKPQFILERLPADTSRTYNKEVYIVPETHPFYRRHIKPRRSIRALWQPVPVSVPQDDALWAIP